MAFSWNLETTEKSLKMECIACLKIDEKNSCENKLTSKVWLQHLHLLTSLTGFISKITAEFDVDVSSGALSAGKVDSVVQSVLSKAPEVFHSIEYKYNCHGIWMMRIGGIVWTFRWVTKIGWTVAILRHCCLHFTILLTAPFTVYCR